MTVTVTTDYDYWVCDDHGGGGGGGSTGAVPGGTDKGAEGGNGGGAGPRDPKPAPPATDWAMCKADAKQALLAGVTTLARVEAFSYGKTLFKMIRAGKGFASPATEALFVGNALYTPSLMAIQEQYSDRGTPNPFEGTAGASWYTFFKHVPVLDAGLELGEAINSCSGRTR
jgi:hypothetical protein